MSKKIIIVPVSPEGYGCGLLLGFLIHYWYVVLIVMLLFTCMIFAPALFRNIFLNRSISATASVERGGENNAEWTIYYTLINHSPFYYIGSLKATLPVRFYDCRGSQDFTAHYNGYFPQVVVPNNGDRSVSGTLEIHNSIPTESVADYMCWQTEGCSNKYGCQQYEILRPKFLLNDASIPVKLK
jgi:hypothetical protein